MRIRFPSSVSDFIILIGAIIAFGTVGAAIARWQYETTGGYADRPSPVCVDGSICYTPGVNGDLNNAYTVVLGGSTVVVASTAQELNMMITYGLVGAVLGLGAGLYNANAKRNRSTIDPNSRL